jgi:tetratricopeptide (TPR) repeat protein
MRILASTQRFFAELKRRNVLRMAAGYGATAFVVIEGADLVFPRIGLSEQSVTAVVWGALLLFPVAIAFAWFFDVEERELRAATPPAPGELEEILEEPAGRRWPIGILAGAGTVLLLTTAWLTLRDGEPGSVEVEGTNSHVIVVLPFEVRGPADHDYLGAGLVDLLTTRLDGIGPLRTVPARSVLGKVRQEGEDVVLEPAVAERVAASLGAGRYVQGEVLELGGRLSISAALMDVGGGPGIEASVDGADDALLKMVDELTAELVAGLEGSASGRVRQLAAETTSSLPALKAYLLGEELLRSGQFTPALAAFEDAVRIDSTFSLAYYRLSIAREWANTDGATEAANAARRHAGRLSERDRLLVEALWKWRHGDGHGGEDLYRTVLGRWPDDMESWLQLAEVLNHFKPIMGGEAEDSRGPFERVLEYEPEHLLSLWHLVRIEARAGNADRADSLVRVIQRLSPEGDRTLELLAMTSAVNDSENWPEIVAALRRSQDITPYYAVWNVAVYSEDIERARELAGLLTEPVRSTEVRATGYLYETVLAQASGHARDAERALTAAEEIDPDLVMTYRTLMAFQPYSGADPSELSRLADELEAWDPPAGCVSSHPVQGFEPASCIRPVVRSWLLGMLYARLGRPEAASDEIRELEEHARTGEDRGHAQLFIPAVRSEMAIQRGDTLEALRILEQAPEKAWYIDALQSPFYSHALNRFRRAELLDAVGRTDEAILWYGSFDEVTTYDVPWKGAAEVRVAELLEASGREGDARQIYEKAAALLVGAKEPYDGLAKRVREGLERTGR